MKLKFYGGVTMEAINTEEVSKLTKNVESDIDDIKLTVSSFENIALSLSSIFKNNGLSKVANNLSNICEGQASILKTLYSYTDTLKKVITAYEMEEEEISNTVRIVTKN